MRSGTDAVTPGRLVARCWLGPGVLGVWVRPRRPVSFLAGQHVTLARGEGVARSYSIANLPQEAARDGLEFHVRVYPRGAMSEWLANAAPGARLHIGPPAGECAARRSSWRSRHRCVAHLRAVGRAGHRGGRHRRTGIAR
jgi:CDP-4-dehydro-6-deoxyglucose reductase, E3